MGIFELVNDIKMKAESINTCNQAIYGNISLYDNMSTIQYPFVNIDVVNSTVFHNSAKRYTLRIYVLDRNVPYVAYNKCELILKNLMSLYGIVNYRMNYFTLNFADQVNGLYVDITYDIPMNLGCQIYEGMGYIILENSDFISKYLLLEDEGRIKLEQKQ